MSYYSSKFICGKCGAIYGLKPEHSNDKYRKDIWIRRNRFKKEMYCKNTRIDNANIDALTCRIAVAAVKKKRHILDLCKSLLKECDVTGSDAMVVGFANFNYSTIEDMSILINRIVVLPDGRTDIFILDGTKHRLKVWKAVQKKIKRFSV